MERATETKERGRNLIKPTYQSFTERQTSKSTPTITPNGLSGSKVFVTLTTSNDALLNKKPTSPKRGVRSPLHQQRAPENTPQDINRQYLESPNALIRGRHRESPLTESRGQSITLTPNRGSILRERRRSSHRSLEVVTSTQPAGPAMHVDVNIPTGGEVFSGMSTNSYTYSEGSASRSCDLDDVRSDISEMLNSPLPPTPVPEKENTEKMKERVHQDLMKTLSETEQFLRAMDQKRKSRPPQIVYSDDEEIAAKNNADITDQHKSNSDFEQQNVGGDDLGQQYCSEIIVGSEPGIYESEVNIPTSRYNPTASQQYLELVHQLEDDLSLASEHSFDDSK